MLDLLLAEGDVLTILPNFAMRIVTPLVVPVQLVANGQFRIGGRRACVLGDDALLRIPAMYTVPPMFITPGLGTITVNLSSHQVPSVRSGAPVLVKGQMVQLLFVPEPTAPAMQPPPNGPTNDPYLLPTPGQGVVMPMQFFVKAG